MKDLSDIDALHNQVILFKMRDKTTEELMAILAEKNPVLGQGEYEAALRVLQERNGSLPEQTILSGQRMSQSQGAQPANADQFGGTSFFHLSPIGNLQTAIVIFVLCGFFVGFIFVNMGKQNTKWFLTFAENAQISDIEKIEVQGIDADGNSVGNTITVSDEEGIHEFVSALKTIEEYNTYHPTQEKRIKVTIWLLEKNQRIELEGYTLSGEERVFYVANLRIEPRMWKFGDGNQKFPAPSFYDWLEKIGMELYNSYTSLQTGDKNELQSKY